MVVYLRDFRNEGISGCGCDNSGDNSFVFKARENVVGTLNNSNVRKCSTVGCNNPAFGDNSQCISCQWNS